MVSMVSEKTVRFSLIDNTANPRPTSPCDMPVVPLTTGPPAESWMYDKWPISEISEFSWRSVLSMASTESGVDNRDT